MSHPSLPPYLGTWEDLLNALLHNPFLGSSHVSRPHTTHMEAESRLQHGGEPSPSSWHGAVTGLIGLLCLKEAGTNLPKGAPKTTLLQGIDSAIADDVDGICPPYRNWHWPGPPPPVLAVVSTLVFAANTLPAGNIRTELSGIATQILQRTVGSTKEASA